MAAACMNQVVLIGNLTADPDLRETPRGKSVCNLRVACRSRRRDPESGEWVDKPNYFNVAVWGGQGESAARHLCKGRSVAIAGRLEWSEWEGRDGATRQAVEVVASDVEFLGGGGPPTEESGDNVVTPIAFRRGSARLVWGAREPEEGVAAAGVASNGTSRAA